MGLFKRHRDISPDEQALQHHDDFLLITWDSCRYDAYLEASTPNMDRRCQPRRATAMGTFTLPAHISMFKGFLPHAFTSEPLYNRYHQQLWRIGHRQIHTKPLVTFRAGTSSIVRGLKNRGYYTVGCAAMNWFRYTELQDGFVDFDPGNHDGARKQNEWLLERVQKKGRDKPCFVFVNYGETHTPFQYEGSAPLTAEQSELLRHARFANQRGLLDPEWKFNSSVYQLQVKAAGYLDARTEDLIKAFEARGRPTTIVVCADHGDCFGENGLYGHAVYHEKVMEVPLLIFRINAPPHDPPQVHPDSPLLPENAGKQRAAAHE